MIWSLLLERLQWVLLTSFLSAFFLCIPVWFYNYLSRRWTLPYRHLVNQIALGLSLLGIVIIAVAFDVRFQGQLSFSTTEPADFFAKPLEETSNFLETKSFEATEIPTWSLALLIWFLGALFFGLRLLNDFLLSYRFVKDSKQNGNKLTLIKGPFRRQVQVITSSDVDEPVTMGVLNPSIFFPEGLVRDLPDEDIQALIAHEHAHVLRFDPIKNLVFQCLRCVFWFNIPLKYLLRQYETTREYDCDRRAVKSGISRIHLGRALGQVAISSTTHPGVLALTGHYSEVTGRMRQLLNDKPDRKRLLITFASLGTTCVMIAWLVSTTVSNRGMELSVIREFQTSAVEDAEKFDLVEISNDLRQLAQDERFRTLSGQRDQSFTLTVTPDLANVDATVVSADTRAAINDLFTKYGLRKTVTVEFKFQPNGTILLMSCDGKTIEFEARSHAVSLPSL